MVSPFVLLIVCWGGVMLALFLLSSRRAVGLKNGVLLILALTLLVPILSGADEVEGHSAGLNHGSVIAILLMGLMPLGAFFFLNDIRRKETSRLLDKYNPILLDYPERGIAITDSKGKILRCNPWLEQMADNKMNGRADTPGSKNFAALVAEGKCSLMGSEEMIRDAKRVVLFNGTDAATLKCDKHDQVLTASGKLNIFFVSHPSVGDPVPAQVPDLIKSCYYNFVPVILVTLDPEGHVILANRYFETFIGRAQLELSGKSWFEEFVPAEARRYCWSVFKQCLDTGREQYFESAMLNGSEQKRHIRWKCGVMEVAGARSVLFSGEDISEQRAQHIQLVNTVDNLNKLKDELEKRVKERTEDLEIINRNLELHIDERDEIERQLVNSERLHMVMAHNFPNGIIAVLDRHLRFLMVDGQELEAMGYTSWGLKGKYISSEEFDMDASALELLRDAFKGRRTSFEFAFKGVYYRVNAVPLPDPENRIEKILAVCQNISEQKKLEQSLYSSLDQERRLNELKSRFVTMASHEFRTPLSTILSSVFLLENYDGAAYSQNKQEHIDRIKRTVTVLTESLNDFLRLGKLEEGQVRLVLSETSVREYMNEIVREMQPVMKAGQEIRYQHQGLAMNVLLDRNVTRGILLNLLSNASKYSPDESPVFLNTLLEEEQLVIEVIDHGLGIPEEEQKHIFDRFFRAVNALHIEGTGLGLHIVKKYVEMMNGTIDFVSENKGTTFTVTIPLKPTLDNSRLILC